jgi:aspartate kinase
MAKRSVPGIFQIKDDIATVSIVGVGMRSHSGVAAKMFATLANERINIMMISTSEIKTPVMDAKYRACGTIAARGV